jgi:hypothetical protein
VKQPSKDDSGLLADGGNVPVARELPPQQAPAPQAPQPTPQPVQQPVERVAAPRPCHGHGREGGSHGDGDSQQ